MRSNQLLFFLLFISLMASCQEEKYKNFDELFTYYLSVQDSTEENSLIRLLDDSISVQPNRYLISYEKIDTSNETLDLHFDYLGSDFLDDLRIKKRNAFIIKIDRDDKIVAERKMIKNIDSLVSPMIEFLLNPNDKKNLPEKRYEVIEFLDTVMVSKQFFDVQTIMLPDITNRRTSWKRFKKVILKIINTYYCLRNKTSVEIWHKRYHELELNKQVALKEFLPIKIWIYFNREHRPPPPPIKSEEILEIIADEDEFDLE